MTFGFNETTTRSAVVPVPQKRTNDSFRLVRDLLFILHTVHKVRTPVNLFTWTNKGKTIKLEAIYNSSVPIKDVSLKTCRKLWTIEKGDEKGSGISELIARQDDDDDDINLCQ